MNSGLKFTLIAAVIITSSVAVRMMDAAPLTNACALLTPAQVSAVVGVSVAAGTPLFPTHPKECQWRATSVGAKIRVQLFLKDSRAFAYAKMSIHGITKVAASGIGDDAVYSSAPRAPSVLSVKKGDVVFDVHVLSYGLPDAKVKAMERALAQKVLAKL